MVASWGGNQKTPWLVSTIDKDNPFGYKRAMSSKLEECDGCDKMRRDVKLCGHDLSGEPDAPALCFVCRKEGERDRVYSKKSKSYVDAYDYFHGPT